MPKTSRRNGIGRKKKKNERRNIDNMKKTARLEDSQREMAIERDNMALALIEATESSEKLRKRLATATDEVQKSKRAMRNLAASYMSTPSPVSGAVVGKVKETTPDMPRSTFYRRMKDVGSALVTMNGGGNGRNQFLVHAVQQLPHPFRVVIVFFYMYNVFNNNILIVIGNFKIIKFSNFVKTACISR